MIGPEFATILLLILMSLLAITAGTLLLFLLFRPARPQLVTPMPTPVARRVLAGGMPVHSLRPASWPPPQPRRPVMTPPRTDPGPAALLMIYSGPLQGNRFPLARPVLALGRSSLCDITIPDPQASRQHARLEWRKDGLYLVDTHSTNGTYVNGHRVWQHRLQGGERIQISHTAFTIHLY